MKTQLNYFSQQRSEMLTFIPKDCKRFLDVGCGGGFFSEQLKKNRQCEIWGIEPIEEAALLAKGKLDNVLTGNVESHLDKLPLNFFDCLILNDVLEHLAKPESVLSILKKTLVKDGWCILSVPNVRYFENLMNLILKKEWEYTNSGILDQTHLRFFTKKSLFRFIEQQGFSVEKFSGINAVFSTKNIGRLQFFLNFLTLNSLEDTKYLQFACLLQSK